MYELFIVTGGCGHLGSAVIKKLCEDGKRVIAFDKLGANSDAVRKMGCPVIFGDVLKPESFEAILSYGVPAEKIAIIHTAGIISITARQSDMMRKVNVSGTKNIVAFCTENKIGKLVYVSSVHALPELPGITSEITSFNPDNVKGEYAKTKAAATAAVLAASNVIDTAIIHPSGIIGPGDYASGHLTSLISDYCNGKLIALIKGGYDFVDVRDVAAAIVASVKPGNSGSCYILSNGYVTLTDLIAMLSNITGRKPIKTVLPFCFAYYTAPLAELYYKLCKKKPLYTKYAVAAVSQGCNFSNEKARRELKFQPRPLSETLKDTCAFLRSCKKIKCKTA